MERQQRRSGKAVRNPFIIQVLRSNLFFPLMAHLFVNAINRKKKMDRESMDDERDGLNLLWRIVRERVKGPIIRSLFRSARDSTRPMESI